MSQLSIIEKAFFLKKTSLFSELDLDLLLAIADKAEVQSYESKEPIFSHNQDAHRLYFIYKGKVDVLDSSERPIATLENYDFFGDEALFAQTPRHYATVAAAPTHVLTLSRTHLVQIMLESPHVALILLSAYASVTPFRKRNGKP